MITNLFSTFTSLMKPVWSIFLILLAIAFMGLPACSQSPDCFREDIYCAGLVTNTAGLRDDGLNQHTWEGLLQAQVEKIIDRAAFIESVDSRDYVKNIEAFALDGYDFIITIGPALEDETLHAADLYPDSVFIGMDQPQEETRPNLLPILFPEDQMGFWAGALAARLTRTGIVGAVCETSGLDSMWRYCEGFRKGAAHADENIKALTLYRENQSSEKLFIDSEWGHTNAQDLIQRGADVIFAAGGGTAQGSLLAAGDEGLLAIGAERDQAQALTEAAPALVTSVYGGARIEVQKWMRLVRDGNVWSGAVNGAFEHAPYQEIQNRVPQELQSEMDQLFLALSSGELQTRVSKSAP